MRKQMKTLYVMFVVAFVVSCSSDGDSSSEPTFPEVVTLGATDVTSNSVAFVGQVQAAGDSPVTSRGFVWDINSGPTIALATKTVNGEGVGDFSATIMGLTANTPYFARAYATNAEGTFYGNEISFTTLQQTLVLGQQHMGGIIAYFLRPGDLGYSASIQHGLIVNPTDNWYAEWGCYTLIGNTSPAFGQGEANTLNISSGQNCASEVAAELVGLSNYGGQSDWYLPSKDELLRIWENWDDGLLDADLFTNNNYWTSTEVNNQKAYIIEFEYGTVQSHFKDSSENICAVRAF